MGSANSAPILSPAIHLTTALARSRPGSISHTREPTSKRASDTAMNPLSEMLRTRASTPLAPSSRIFASSSTGRREKRLRSLWSSAIRALIMEKSIPIRHLLQRSSEGHTDPPVFDPPDLRCHEALVKKLQGQGFADVRDVWENDHSSGFRDVDEPNHMFAAAKFHHRRARG